MSHGPHQFQQSSLAKVFKALAQARLKARVELDTGGKISVYVEAPVASGEPAPEIKPDEWDKWANE